MKHDDQSPPDPMRREQFVAWLTQTTVSDFARSKGQREQLRTAVFLFLNRAYEARLDPDLIVELLGIRAGNIIDAAGLDKTDEAVVMDEYERLDGLTFNVHNTDRSGSA